MGITIEKINDSLIEFTELVDYGDGKPVPYVDAYLLIGTERAILIDSLQNTSDLYERVREYTDLPLDVLITHGHGDHVGAGIGVFVDNHCDVYMSEIDIQPLMAQREDLKENYFKPLAGGMTFEAGGFTLEVIDCPGHTLGSVVFVERQKQWMFSGDSIGSGSFWMQIPGTLPIYRFKEPAMKLLNSVKDLTDLLIFPGHRNQSPVQLTLQYVMDTVSVVEGLLDGTLKGTDRILQLPWATLQFKSVAYGQMLDFCYDENRIHADVSKSE